jgi:copper(I)-binding protein
VRLLIAAAALVAFPALAQVEIEQPWSRASAPGAQVASGYMVIRNTAAKPDRLVGASSAAAARVEMHVHIRDGEIMRMREVKGYDVPAKGRFELKPSGAHLMFVDLKAPFKEGQRIPVTLKFQNAGEVRTEFVVQKLGATAPHRAH